MIEHQAPSAAGEWDSHSPAVVGVDGSARNRAAVHWAAHEAAGAGRALRLVAVSEPSLLHRLPHPAPRSAAHRALDDARVTAERYVAAERIETEVAEGPVEDLLLERARDAGMLVVGKRGRHAIPRMLVGSTSLAVAGRSPVPVAVVPDEWQPERHAGGAVVVGVDPAHATDALLHLAFGRAGRLDVPLEVVHGREELDDAAGTGADEDPTVVEKLLGPWRESFPRVAVTAHERAGHPAVAVLDVAEGAQLVVLGRRNSSRFTGFGFGSVTRAVLHYATCPVLVVPTDAG